MFSSRLVVTLSSTKKIVIFFGIATNDLFLVPPYNFSYYTYNNIPGAIEASDMNNDGFIDLVVSRHSTALRNPESLSIFLNRGDGRQFESIRFNPADWPKSNIMSIAIGDFNNDGRQNDLSLCSVDGQVRTFVYLNYNDPSRSMKPAVNYTYQYPSIMIKGRFNDDELDDVALVSSQSDTLQVLLAYGNGGFIQQIYLTDSYPTSIASINFNNDRIDDLAILSCNGTVTVFLGTKLGLFNRNYLSFENNVTSSGKCFQSLKVADLNQDGRDDLVYIDAERNCIRVLLGLPCNE